jgi:hypothetical protein
MTIRDLRGSNLRFEFTVGATSRATEPTRRKIFA